MRRIFSISDRDRCFSLGRKAFEEQVDKDIGRKLMIATGGSLNMPFDHGVELGLAHVGASRFAHCAPPCWNNMRCFQES